MLLVDDERALADLYATWLDGVGALEVVYSSADALGALTEERPDVVLLDRWMPDLPGDEVLATIRERGLDCRVAMVTAVAPDFDIIDLACDSYILKPVRPEELRVAVERLHDLSEYPQSIQRLYTLIEKRALLESEKTVHELAASEAFADLIDDIESERSRARTHIESVSDENLRTFLD